VARIRTIKPEFWKHEDLSALPEATHMLAAALLNYADDEGYFNANIKLVQSECCPLREPSVSVHDSLNLLVKAGFLALGSSPDGKRYGRVVNFVEHQRVNRPKPSKIKDLEIAWDASEEDHTHVSEPSPPEGNREGNREQGTGKGMDVAARGTRLPDTWKPDVEFGRKEGFSDDDIKREADKFRDHWRQQPGAKGRKVDWDAAWRNWLRSDYQRPAGRRGPMGDNQGAGGRTAAYAEVAARYEGGQ